MGRRPRRRTCWGLGSGRVVGRGWTGLGGRRRRDSAVILAVAAAAGLAARPVEQASSVGWPSGERAQKPRGEAGRPRGGGLQPRFQVAGPACGDRAQAGEGDEGGEDASRSRAPTCRTSSWSTCRPTTARSSRAYEDGLKKELSDYLLEHARTQGLALLTRPTVELETDDRLRLGEFGIQAKLVKPPRRAGGRPLRATSGTRWSTRPRAHAGSRSPRRRPADPRAARRRRTRHRRAGPPRSVIGRSPRM